MTTIFPKQIFFPNELDTTVDGIVSIIISVSVSFSISSSVIISTGIDEHIYFIHFLFFLFKCYPISQ